jgi:DNA-binding GntR family transcriptional regulator
MPMQPGGRRPNRATGVRQALEHDIVSGVLRPGDKLDERQLSERFGLSRTPIREALRQLTAVGLAASEPRRGTIVAEITLSDLIEMFEAMVEIEVICAALAARRMTSAMIASLDDLQREAGQHVAAGDPDGYFFANVRFHEAIYAGAQNGYLERLAVQLSRRLSPYRRLQLRRPQRLTTSDHEHTDILDAIRRHDPEKAAQVMRRHVSVQGEGLVDLASVFSRGVGATA